MRQQMIQHHEMNVVGVQPADFVIAPDVTSLDLSEFSRADEMALIGETATNVTITKLHKMLSKLDPKLFGTSSSSRIPSDETVAEHELAERMTRVQARARGAG